MPNEPAFVRWSFMDRRACLQMEKAYVARTLSRGLKRRRMGLIQAFVEFSGCQDEDADTPA